MPRPPLSSNIVCYHCESKDTSKAGFNRGKQRYYCRACRRWFRENPVITDGGKLNKGRHSKNLPSEGHLILSLQAISQRLGRTPTTTDTNELSKAGRSYPLNNYYDVFGSFIEAIKKAGLKAIYKQKFDKEKLLGEPRELRTKPHEFVYVPDVGPVALALAAKEQAYGKWWNFAVAGVTT